MIGCEPFSPEQEKQLIDYYQSRRHAERNIALLTFGIQTGFRISEILSITIGDIIKGGKMVDRVYIQRCHMKGGKTGRGHGHSQVLAKNTQKALQTQIDYLESKGRIGSEQYVFQTQTYDYNKAMTFRSCWRLLNYAAKELGMTIKVGTHSMRKTFAARIYQNLLDKNNADALRILQAGLGHDNINNTIKYLAFEDTELNNSIADVFGG